MKNKKILIVDDNEDFLNSFEIYFKKLGWEVTADNGHKIDCLLEKKYLNEKGDPVYLSDFQCLILDHELPHAHGYKILRKALNLKEQLPPTILLSGYLTKDEVENYLQLGATICCKKPIRPETLTRLADLLINGDLESLIGNENNLNTPHGIAIAESQIIHILKTFRSTPTFESISEEVKERESFLTEYFKKSTLAVATSKRYEKIDNPVFIVGRRWNSWYPSYFNVPGGAYVIVMPKHNNKNEVILIDPGFKSLQVISDDLNISVADISTCIISHNHPDHMGGIFEYIACRNTLNEESHFYCNSTTLEMFSHQRNKNQIDDTSISIIENHDKEKYREILLSGFKTSHSEIGSKNDPRAIEIEFVQPDSTRNKIVILGDTKFKPEFIELLADQNLRILVLHIGSAQLKKGVGNHLYIEGTRELLVRLDHKLKDLHVSENHLLVLISEWGLEHASQEQLKKIGIKGIPDEFEGSPIKDIIKCLENELKYINILPADIGLMVDILDKNIFVVVEENEKYPFDKIHYHIDSDGIKYTKAVSYE